MKQYLKPTLITLGIAIIAYALFSLVMLAVSVRSAIALRSTAQTIISDLSEQNLESAFAAYNGELKPNFKKIKFRTAFSGWVAYVPVARQPYLAFREVLMAGESLISVADDALAKGVRLENGKYVFDATTISTVGLQRYEDILEALDLLQQAGARISRLSPDLVPESLNQDWQDALGLAEQLRIQLEIFEPFISDLPTLLGQEEPYDIIVLLQNPHELRATGGFIGTYGRLTFDRGRITTFFTDDIYNLDVHLLTKKTPTPPQPMQQYLRVNEWYVRDSNWSPDFPTSSRQIIDLYKLASGEEDIDMVVAVTPAIVEEFLSMTGPITVDGITFTKENLIDELEYRVEQEFWRIGLRNDERKKIINDLAQALKSRFFDMDAAQMRRFAGMVQTILRQKDILMYSTDAQTQRDILAAGWGGELRSSANDYVFVVDSNFGALKTDRILDRTFTYSVTEQSDGKWIATLHLTYTNDGIADYRTARYRTYTRIYVPFGSALRQASGFMLSDRMPPNAQPAVYTEEGKTVFAGFVSVELGQTRSVSLTYELPDWLGDHFNERQQYALLWQKQPGTKTPVQFVLNSQQNLYSFAPSQLSYKLENPKQIRVSSDLAEDRALTVKFAP